MAKPKTMIIYAATASIAAVSAAIAPARERGQAVRLVALEEFRGETEQNAGAVYVERRADDELIVDRIRQAYPLIEVQDWSGSVDVDDHQSFQPQAADETLKELRLQLIAMGGSAPAGADAAQLADLIAAQRLEQNRHPILPNAATQGTTVPDSTPISQKPDGDKLIDVEAAGTTSAAVKAATEVAGSAPVGGGSPTAGPSEAAGTAPASDEGEAPTAEQLVSRNSKEALLEQAKAAGVTDVTEDNNKAEIAAKIVAARS